MIYVGTSGYGFHEWSPAFYPPELCYDGYLEFYSTRFGFCELDHTFFKMPDRRAIERLGAAVPPSFRMTAKLFRGLTHEREGDLQSARRFAEALAPLVESERLGPVLAQFPFSFVNNPHSRAYLCRLRAALELPLVVELRNESWIHDETLEFLKGWGIGLASIDGPEHCGLLNRHALATTDIGYVRFHGRREESWWRAGDPRRYDYRYRQRELLSWLPRVREISKRAEDVYLVFNNHRYAHAVTGAEMVTKLLYRSRKPRPAQAAARAG